MNGQPTFGKRTAPGIQFSKSNEQSEESQDRYVSLGSTRQDLVEC